MQKIPLWIWTGEDESPGTVISALKVNGALVDRACAGEIVYVDIAGKGSKANYRINPGQKVYRTSDRPIDRNKVYEQVNRTGGTPFEFKRVDITLDDNVSLPVSEINACRRKALEQLEGKLAESYERDDFDRLTLEEIRDMPEAYVPDRGVSAAPCQGTRSMGISVYFHNMPSAVELHELCGLDKGKVLRIYLPFSGYVTDGDNYCQ